MRAIPSIRPRRLAVGSTLILATLTAGPAAATYPGSSDGWIASGITVDGNADIYTALPSGNGLHRLTTDPAFDACPTFSADGKWIAWCATRAGATEIWLMRQDGSEARQITTLGGSATFPDIAPDGNRIAFGARVSGRLSDVYVINVDGTGLVRLTTSPVEDRFPVWSPDGTRIAFLSGVSGVEEVWLMDPDGADKTQLTFDGSQKDQLPDWRPDGGRIAYVVQTPGSFGGHIWVIDADGGNATQLTSGPARDLGVAWSPDGDEIATTEFGGQGVKIVDLATGERRGVFTIGTVQRVPAWQPRGNRLP